MQKRRRSRSILLALAAASSLGLGVAIAQPHRGDHGGPGHGHGGHDPAHGADMQAIHFLLQHRAAIRRTVKDIAGGVETVTESDSPEVAAKLGTHVQAMVERMKEGRPIHARDPLFAALFRKADKVTIKVESTPKGVKVIETSQDPRVTALIRSHARVVTAFIENGHAEMMRNHPVPDAP